MTDSNTTQNENTTETETAKTFTSRVDRLRSLASEKRTRITAVATAAVLGIGLVGAIAANSSDSTTSATVAEAAAAEARTAAQRADRGDRTALSATPTAPAPQAPKAPQATTTKKPAPRAAASTKQATSPAPAPKQITQAAAAKAAPKPAWQMPQPGAEVTSCYGPRWGTTHEGIDFASSENTPNRAAAAGTVISAGWNDGGYGNMVIIEHANGIYTLYAHANSVAVSVGEQVEAGDIVSYEGSTGDSTGPHLHFEVWNAMWSRIDPTPWLRDNGVNFQAC